MGLEQGGSIKEGIFGDSQLKRKLQVRVNLPQKWPHDGHHGVHWEDG